MLDQEVHRDRPRRLGERRNRPRHDGMARAARHGHRPHGAGERRTARSDLSAHVAHRGRSRRGLSPRIRRDAWATCCCAAFPWRWARAGRNPAAAKPRCASAPSSAGAIRTWVRIWNRSKRNARRSCTVPRAATPRWKRPRTKYGISPGTPARRALAPPERRRPASLVTNSVTKDLSDRPSHLGIDSATKLHWRECVGILAAIGAQLRC